MSSSRIPPLLEPHLGQPPEAALVVLTSVLGASANWLLLRWLHALLLRPGSGSGSGVVLVSFMRDGAFWRDGAARLGLDLEAVARTGRFVFVDGLTGLFAPPRGHGSQGPADAVLRSSRVDHVRALVDAAVAAVQAPTVLVMDHVDALLAAAAPADGVTSLSLQALLLSLRERVHATILTLAADDPLVHAQTTRLEREHAALVLSLAHAARSLFALRMLDTGAARDVSGVVRIADRAALVADELDPESEPGPGHAEYLYHVAGDGSVRVFERGA